jgi:hypothetical protein
MPAFADSCGIRIVVVNHRADAVAVSLKSFYADRALAAPSPRDFDAPLYGTTVPPYFSSLQQIEVPAHGAASVAFRQLCVGDFWVNWRRYPPTGKSIRRARCSRETTNPSTSANAACAANLRTQATSAATASICAAGRPSR